MSWMWEENRSTDVLIGKIIKRSTECEKITYELYWARKNYVRDVLIVSKLCQRWTESGKIMEREAPIARKLCMRCTEVGKFV